jgi:hypothetical protein
MHPVPTRSLRKLLLLAVPDGTGERPPATVEPSLDCLFRVWEWIELVAASSAPAAIEVARRARRPILIEPDLALPDSLRDAALHRAREQRAARGLAHLEASGADCVLLVLEAAMFAALWSALTEVPLPADRPRTGDVGLLTRRADGRWLPGRNSSDPPPLRSTLERDGIADPCTLAREPLRHVAPLQLGEAQRRAFDPPGSA